MTNTADGDALDPFFDSAGNRPATDGHPGGSDRLDSGLDTLCDALTRSIGMDGAAVAILTGSRRVRELVYASDETARQLDELQFTLGEGPCLDAFVRNWPQLWAHLDTTMSVDALWPGFAVAAIEIGARALFAFPIPNHRGPIGVLELYRHTAGSLQPDKIDAAAECAAALGVALLDNWRTHRSRAASSNAGDETAVDVVDDSFTPSALHIAAGMTAVQLDVTPDEGLDRLRAYAYAQQQSITAVAADIIGRRLSLRDQHDDAAGA